MGCCHLCDKKLQEIDYKVDHKPHKRDNHHLELELDASREKMLKLFEPEEANSNPLLFGKNSNKNELNNTGDLINNNINLNKGIYGDFVFGFNNILKVQDFLDVCKIIFQISLELPTTYYTFGYTDVKEIMNGLEKRLNPPIISDKLFNFVTNNSFNIMKYKNYPNIYKAIYEIFIKENDYGVDFQTEIIISTLKFIMLNSKFEEKNKTCALVKLFQDIGFCIRIFYYSLKSHLFKDRFAYEYDFDIRVLYCLNLMENLSYNKEYPYNLLKLATESARIKDTIILGNSEFRMYIKYLNLSNERINDLDDFMLENFFQSPFLEKKKYKVVKYFIICQYEDYEKRYLQKFKYLSSKYGFAYLFLVQIDVIKFVKVKEDLKVQNSVIYFFDEDELREIYKDNNERLRPRLREYIKENYTSFKLENIKCEEMMIYDKIENLKSTSEDGWDLFKYKKDSIYFNVSLVSANFQDFIRHIIGHLIDAYTDHNSLEIFYKYYSNYFFLSLQPEFVVNMTAFVKMFLYAYTLEEGDPNKNLYCIVNDDLRSCVPEKVNRYIELIKVIGALVKMKEIKSYNGMVYRASFLKDELIKNIKIGETIINSAFWSSTKKESVARKFLKGSHKNALIVTEGELINNIDIHSERISKYPDEEEVLFLPFCNFRVISFENVYEGNLRYYKLVLKSVSQTSLIEPYIQMHINRFNCENKEIQDDNVLYINLG